MQLQKTYLDIYGKGKENLFVDRDRISSSGKVFEQPVNHRNMVLVGSI